MERQGKELRSLEAYCKGGQGPPQAVAPFGGGGKFFTGFLYLTIKISRKQTE
jgi:hypothetical protein